LHYSTIMIHYQAPIGQGAHQKKANVNNSRQSLTMVSYYQAARSYFPMKHHHLQTKTPPWSYESV